SRPPAERRSGFHELGLGLFAELRVHGREHHEELSRQHRIGMGRRVRWSKMLGGLEPGRLSWQWYVVDRFCHLDEEGKARTVAVLVLPLQGIAAGGVRAREWEVELSVGVCDQASRGGRQLHEDVLVLEVAGWPQVGGIRDMLRPADNAAVRMD